MSDIIFALNATLPIVMRVVLGYILKKIGMIDSHVTKTANKLVFRVFLPAMLFLNVYKIDRWIEEKQISFDIKRIRRFNCPRIFDSCLIANDTCNMLVRVTKGVCHSDDLVACKL